MGTTDFSAMLVSSMFAFLEWYQKHDVAVLAVVVFVPLFVLAVVGVVVVVLFAVVVVLAVVVAVEQGLLHHK